MHKRTLKKINIKEIGFSRRVDILLQNSNSKPETSLGYTECSAFRWQSGLSRSVLTS